MANMFKKDEMQNEGGNNTNKTIIGPSVKIEGDFISDESIEVQGKVIGTLKTTKDLLVGNNANIKAEVEAANLNVSGEIKGNITISEKTELSSTAKINGDITTNTISIESGAVVNGRCTSGQDGKTAEKKVSLKKED